MGCIWLLVEGCLLIEESKYGRDGVELGFA
jgi:hypothetical protein